MTPQSPMAAGPEPPPDTGAAPGAGPMYRVRHVRALTPDVFVVRVDRHGMRPRAGQHVTLGIAGSGINREYSVYSGESDPHLEFLIRVREGSAVSRALQRAVPGTGVDLAGPYGEFTIRDPDDGGRRYLFVATGVGIAPFRSFVRTYPGLDYRLLHGVRSLRDCFDAGAYPPERYQACVSGEAGTGFPGRVTDYLRQHPADPDAHGYLCGHAAMISEVYDLLRAQGVPSDNLFTEVFY